MEEELQTSMVRLTQLCIYESESGFGGTVYGTQAFPPFCLFFPKMVGMVIGAGIAIVLIAILIFFILRRIQLRSE